LAEVIYKVFEFVECGTEKADYSFTESFVIIVAVITN